MKSKRSIIGLFSLVCIITLTSCNLPTRVEYIGNPEVEEKATEGALTLQALMPGDQEAEVIENPEPAETEPPPPPEHQIHPDESPPGEPQVIHDQESDRKAAQKEAYGGDEYNLGRYERPFDSDMNYIPAIDIYQANLFRDKNNEWIYTIIRLMESPVFLPDMAFSFGIELDLDLDGRGDILIWTDMPQSDEWSVEGVSVLKDLNKSIGGKRPMISDPPPGGDGYEAVIFENGTGEDPDLAWSRLNREDNTFIEIAFKKELLGEMEIFLWGAWADHGMKDLELFDHHDHFTKEEAGSPMRSEEVFYPLKAVFAVDNTCRAASGYTAKGGEPGLCPVPPPPAGGPGPAPTDPPPGQPDPPELY